MKIIVAVIFKTAQTFPNPMHSFYYFGHDPAIHAHSPENQPYPGLHQKQHDQQVEGGDSAPLLHSGETPPGVLRPALEPAAQERHGLGGAGPEEGYKNDPRAGAPLL